MGKEGLSYSPVEREKERKASLFEFAKGLLDKCIWLGQAVISGRTERGTKLTPEARQLFFDSFRTFRSAATKDQEMSKMPGIRERIGTVESQSKKMQYGRLLETPRATLHRAQVR